MASGEKLVSPSMNMFTNVFKTFSHASKPFCHVIKLFSYTSKPFSHAFNKHLVKRHIYNNLEND